MCRILTACCLLLSCGVLSAAEPTDKQLDNWHQWRGPLANGLAPRGNPPLEWSETESVRWKVKLPGEGSSTPIVWEDRVFVLTAVETDRMPETPPKADRRAKTTPPNTIYEYKVLCFDRATGEELWQKTAVAAAPHEGRHPTNTFASSSPITDGERLYVWFGSRGVFCFDLDGKLLWERDLGDMRTRRGWGEGTSPVVHGEDVIINWDHEDQSFLTVLDAKTGKTRWKVDRDEVTSWATPLVVEHDGVTQIVVNGTNRARGYNLENGKVLWACGGQTVNAIPSPVRLGENVIVMSGYTGSTAVSIPLSARGDVTGTKTVRWEVDKGTPYVPSPLLVGERLYFTRKNSAILTCVNAESGERLFGPVRLPGIRSLYASPVAAAGRVYFIGRDGNALVIEDADEFKVLAENKLEARIDASPAIVGDEMFLRGRASLYCIGDGRQSLRD